MGWKEYLEDYEAREMAEYETFKRKISNGTFTSKDIYPQAIRFPEIKRPISRTFSIQDISQDDNIWAIIPLGGSTIQGLPPFPEHMLKSSLGFSISEIPEVISFVKETGKLQFTLRDYPTKYLECPFLEPIFRELNPPVGVNLPPTAFIEEKDFRRYMAEFNKFCESKVFPHILKWSREETGATTNGEILIGQYRHTYTFLRALGYDSIVNQIETYSLSGQVNELAAIMMVSGTLIIQPAFEPIARSFSYDTALYQSAVGFANMHKLEMPKPTFPVEIGEYIIKKLVHCAPSLDACKQLVFNYQDQDLYKLHEALAEGIVANNPDVISKASKDFSLVMDEIWNDKSLLYKVNGLKVGVPVLFGVVGGLAAGLSGGIGGVLAGLGISATDKFIGGINEGVAEKIAKIKSSNWEVVVYDFKNKYKLHSMDKKIGK
ncbi:MAG: hypothetical protein ABSB10_02220 [Candidatus Bathyarchaeia archaeon]